MHKSKVEDTYFRGKSSIQLGDICLDLTTPVVMGILNVTPDSFYANSRKQNGDQLVVKANEMILHGAAILDVGGYSSRPGATDISIDEELERVIPSIELLKRELDDPIISIDTFRGKVAEEAVKAGALIINDISGFQIDPEMIKTLEQFCPAYVLMHMRGTPQTMTKFTDYDDLLDEVNTYFSDKIRVLNKVGIQNIILDPGFGFSKTADQSHQLLSVLEEFQSFDLPILAGLSRKSMIYKRLGKTPEDSLEGTVALNAIALSKGAKILRVHDVRPAAELIRLLFGSDEQI